MSKGTQYIIRKRYKQGKNRHGGPSDYYLKRLTPGSSPMHVWTPRLAEAKVFRLGLGERPPVMFSDFYLIYDMVVVEEVTELRIIE